jgi:hypothetical protein
MFARGRERRKLHDILKELFIILSAKSRTLGDKKTDINEASYLTRNQAIAVQIESATAMNV